MFALAKFFSRRTSRTLNEFETVRKSVLADLLVQGWTPLEALEFVGWALVPLSEEVGRPIFVSADAAAIYSGGIEAVDLNDVGGRLTGSVLWNEDGCRGGAGGGVKEFGKRVVVGWVPF